MKLNYDSRADALYIKLRTNKIDESDEISEGIIIDYDNKNRPVGIEFLNASNLFGGKREMHIEVERDGSPIIHL